MNTTMTYDVFSSFASKDEPLVQPMWQKIAASGLNAFWSDETLKARIGESFLDVIQRAVVSSKHFLLFASDHALNSGWAEDEYDIFYQKCHVHDKKNRRFIILPLAGFDTFKLPPLLQIRQHATTVDQVIEILGGYDIEALAKENWKFKEENNRLHSDLQNASKQVHNLEQKTEELIEERKSL